MSHFRLIVFCLGLAVCVPAFSAQGESALAYKKAADNYYLLIHSTKKFPRDEWTKAVELFKDVYTKNPKGSKTEKALFMTGRISQFMYLRFGKPSDMENAVTIFRVLVRSYPTSALADDALMRTGQLYEAARDYDEAMAAYRGVLKWFPTGDMAVKAKNAMKKVMQNLKPKVVTAKKPVKKRGLAELKSVRYWSSDSYVRVVFDMSRIVNYRVMRSKKGAGLVVDILGTRRGENARSMKLPRGPVKEVNIAGMKNDAVRVKLPLRSFVKYSAMELSNPARVVLDFYGKRKKDGTLLARNGGSGSSSNLLKSSNSATADASLVAAGLLSAPKPQSKKYPKTKKASLPAPSYRVKTIVIDPGHGGKDPGAIGKSGLREKDIALDIAKRLKRILKKQCKCRVLMTRTRDVFIPLEERTAFANTNSADLFVSIHVNAHKNRRARGVETYFLSPTRSRDALHTAARENMLALGSGDRDMNDLAFILSDMKNTDKINESSKMAGMVNDELVSTLSRKYKVRNNGVKKAMFYVLHGARMPSILVETSFITNRTEEKRLADPTFRERVAKGIANGVKSFMGASRLASYFKSRSL